MKRTLFLLLFSLCLSTVDAQKKEISLKEYFADAQFFFTQEAYIDALSDYQQVYSMGYENNANINYHIGVCYLNIPGQKFKSIPYLEKATLNASLKYRESTLNEVYAPLDAYLYLGNAYRIDNQLDTAIARYKTYLGMISEKSQVEKDYVNKQIESCLIAKEYMDNPVPVSFINMGSLINTSSSNYNPVLSGDGNTLVYMIKLPFYEAVFMSQKRGKNWSRPVNITPQLMSDGDQTITGISYDGKTILLAKADVFDSDIYYSEFVEGQWSKSKSISKNINTKFWETEASFSADGKVIYFSSNRKGDGTMDLYKSVLGTDGDWGMPVNLGEGVNTPLNEASPFVTADGKRLYFASQGHRGMGGYDLYFAEWNDTSWTNPQNLNYPFSTTDEDMFFYPFKNGEIGYVYKILENGYGVYDIYEVTLVEQKEEPEHIEPVSEPIALVVEPTEIKTDSVIKPEPAVIELRPILFGFDRSVIQNDTLSGLAFLAQLLLDNPQMKIRLSGHTDALGSETYNQYLSERRAKTIANYFIGKGVSSKQLEVIGMGEKSFIAQNTTSSGDDNPEGRKYNRRVELELIQYPTDKYLVKSINIVPDNYRLAKP